MQFQTVALPTLVMESLLWSDRTLSDAYISSAEQLLKERLVPLKVPPIQSTFWAKRLAGLHISRLVNKNLTPLKIDLTLLVIVTESSNTRSVTVIETFVLLAHAMTLPRSSLSASNTAYTLIEIADAVIPLPSSL